MSRRVFEELLARRCHTLTEAELTALETKYASGSRVDYARFMKQVGGRAALVVIDMVSCYSNLAPLATSITGGTQQECATATLLPSAPDCRAPQQQPCKAPWPHWRQQPRICA